ncbi:MAG: hypothetical protein AAGF83_10930 [Cyanobacteria bacterium P01_G01_bin.67]
MKKFVISTMSALAFSSLVTPVLADEVNTINRANASGINQITPFNLVQGSYQGRFRGRGIPSHSSLLTWVRSKRIKAEDLVRGAIASGRLSEATFQDTRYLNSVKFLLGNLARH